MTGKKPESGRIVYIYTILCGEDLREFGELASKKMTLQVHN